jgi:hypothetical protein
MSTGKFLEPVGAAGNVWISGLTADPLSQNNHSW